MYIYINIHTHMYICICIYICILFSYPSVLLSVCHRGGLSFASSFEFMNLYRSLFTYLFWRISVSFDVYFSYLSVVASA